MTIIKKFVGKIKSFGKKILEKTRNVLSKSKILLTKSAFVLYYGFGLKQLVDFITSRIRIGMTFYNDKFSKPELGIGFTE